MRCLPSIGMLLIGADALQLPQLLDSKFICACSVPIIYKVFITNYDTLIFLHFMDSSSKTLSFGRTWFFGTT